MKRTITPEMIREFLDYDAETGKFLWRHRASHWFNSDENFRAWNTKYAGKPAFTTRSNQGYHQGGILKVTVKAHRAAIAHARGYWPPDQVDHINGIKDDNRLANLREVDRNTNVRNCGLNKNNKSGRVGVCIYKPTGKWVAHIRVDGRTRFLGYHNNFDDAVRAREAAEFHYGFTINNRRAAASAYKEIKADSKPAET